MSHSVIDNRDELRRQIPERCPECGGQIQVDEVESHSWKRGERTTWLSLDWYCLHGDHEVGAPRAYGKTTIRSAPD